MGTTWTVEDEMRATLNDIRTAIESGTADFSTILYDVKRALTRDPAEAQSAGRALENVA